MLYLERWYKPCHLQVIFNGPSIKRWLNTLYTYIHLVKNIKNKLKTYMCWWYLGTSRSKWCPLKTFNIKCFLNRLLNHSKLSACFTEISRLSQSCVPRYLKVLCPVANLYLDICREWLFLVLWLCMVSFTLNSLHRYEGAFLWRILYIWNPSSKNIEFTSWSWKQGL